MVEGDLYDICHRIKEIDPNLFIVQLVDDAANCNFAIMEYCSDGMERLVFKTKELDQRILTRLQEMLAVPFEQRFAMIEAEIDREEEAEKERASEELYENMGRPMWKQLHDSGFIQRGVSFPKTKMTGAGRL
jgi:hypothetical protein